MSRTSISASDTAPAVTRHHRGRRGWRAKQSLDKSKEGQTVRRLPFCAFLAYAPLRLVWMCAHLNRCRREERGVGRHDDRLAFSKLHIFCRFVGDRDCSQLTVWQADRDHRFVRRGTESKARDDAAKAHVGGFNSRHGCATVGEDHEMFTRSNLGYLGRRQRERPNVAIRRYRHDVSVETSHAADDVRAVNVVVAFTFAQPPIGVALGCRHADRRSAIWVSVARWRPVHAARCRTRRTNRSRAHH